MRILIIGAVAAGTSAAAKARRNNEQAEIVIYDKDSFISYSGCGMPYYIGGEVEHQEELIPRNPAFFKEKYNVDINTRHEVLSINRVEKTITVKNLISGDIINDRYDKLIIATGATPFVPEIQGNEQKHVFSLRNIHDMQKIKGFIEENQPKSAVIIGTGFIGMEVAENLKELGLQITLVEKLPHVTPGLDADIGVYLRDYIQKQGIEIYTDATVSTIDEKQVILADGTQINSDLVLIATGVRPSVDLAKQAGIELGLTGAIKVDARMITNDEDIYACGDCIEHFNLINKRSIYRPLGSTANKTGRIAGDQITGGNLLFRGILETGIFKFFDMSVAITGLSEIDAKKQGYETVVCHNIKPDKPEYMGGKEMVIKGIAEKNTGRLLGVQIVGYEGVDKRIDVFVTAITFGANVEDLFHLDLAYAPPFSTTKDPVMYTGMILDNAIHNQRPVMHAQELEKLINSGEKYQVIDSRVASQYEKNHIATAVNIPHASLRDSFEELEKDVVTITYCNKGVTGNAAQNILINNGFKEVYNLSGGYKQYSNSKK